MPAPVKPRPTYRQLQAQATRERIAAAARRLFGTDGDGATSMEAIAREAGAATRTVYAAFGTKREILSLICERWIEEACAEENWLARCSARPTPSGACAAQRTGCACCTQQDSTSC